MEYALRVKSTKKINLNKIGKKTISVFAMLLVVGTMGISSTVNSFANPGLGDIDLGKAADAAGTGAIAGAVSGAALGTVFGSFAGPAGTVAGAAGGAAEGVIGGAIFAATESIVEDIKKG